MDRRTHFSRRAADAQEAGAPRRAAAPNLTTRTVHLTLGWQRADGMLVVIATTLKRGATYHDSWFISPSLAIVSVTVAERSVPRRLSYVSRAVVAASSLEADTTYTFSYAIVMKAAERTWARSGSLTVTVGHDRSLSPHDAPVIDPPGP